MRLLRLLSSIFAFVFLTVISVPEAEAAYNPKGSCRSKLRIWNGSAGWGAFVTNRRGRYCAWSQGYKSKRRAIRAALRKCGRKRRCRVISTRSPRKLARLRGTCLRSFRKWKNQPGYRAFALAKNGSSCSWSWEGANLAAARKRALDGCKAKEKCTIYSTLVPADVLKLRQRHLKELGLYGGKIDAIWGRGTKRAMVTFARWADYPASDDDEIYDRLNWAVRVKRTYDVDSETAAKLSKKAAQAGAVSVLAKELGFKSSAPKTHVRSDKFAAHFGGALFGGGSWPYGKSAWTLSKKSLSADKTRPACVLAGRGLAFAQMSDPESNPIIVLNRTNMSLGEKAATLRLSNGSSFELPVRNKPELGSYVEFINPAKKFLELSLAKSISVVFKDKKGGVSFSTARFQNNLNGFMRCILDLRKNAPKIVAKAPVKAPTNAAKSASKPDGGTAETRRSSNGQYTFLVELDAEPIRMLVDTGASFVAISESTAKKIGITLKKADFKHKTTTANGITTYAKAVAKELRVGSIVMENVQLSVLRDESLVGIALLGMTFLNRLERFEFVGNKLRLVQ